MSKTSGLYRVGRDVEVRYLNDGTAVANVSLAFNYGRKDDQGNKPTQWIEGSMFGQRAEVLGPMLTKGSQHCFFLSDCHIETYQKNDGGEGFKMVGRIDDVSWTDRRDQAPQQQAPRQQQPQRQAAPQQRPQGGQQQRPQGNQQPQRQAPPPQRQGNGGFNDMDDDIPFRDPMANRAFCMAVQ